MTPVLSCGAHVANGSQLLIYYDTVSMLVAFWLNYLLCLGHLSHCKVCISKSSVPAFFLVWYHDVSHKPNSAPRSAARQRNTHPNVTSERMRRILKAIGDLERKGSGFRERRSSCGIKEKEVDHVPQVAEI